MVSTPSPSPPPSCSPLTHAHTCAWRLSESLPASSSLNTYITPPPSLPHISPSATSLHSHPHTSSELIPLYIPNWKEEKLSSNCFLIPLSPRHSLLPPHVVPSTPPFRLPHPLALRARVRERGGGVVRRSIGGGRGRERGEWETGCMGRERNNMRGR